MHEKTDANLKEMTESLEAKVDANHEKWTTGKSK
jgi:hypothetical protein